jgi:hypothetical protein
LAGLRSRGCAEPISVAHRKLNASTTIWRGSRARRQRRDHCEAKELPTPRRLDWLRRSERNISHYDLSGTQCCFENAC